MYKLLLFLLPVILLSCGTNKQDEQMIGETLKAFYSCWNKGKYKEMEQYVSPNMLKEIASLKSFSNNKTTYDPVKIVSIDKGSEKALVEVSTTDEFGNKVDYIWNMIKIKNKWLVNNYNNKPYSVLQNLSNSKHFPNNNFLKPTKTKNVPDSLGSNTRDTL